MAEKEFNPRNRVDMTPATTMNWAHLCPPKGPVLMVNPEATLHDRVSLAWALTGELCTIADGSTSQMDDNVPRFVVALMSDRLELLHRLLGSIGDLTSGVEPATGV